MKAYSTRFLKAAGIAALLVFAACKTLGIDPTFTFNVNQSFNFDVPPGIPAGQLYTLPGVPFGVNPDSLKAHNTDLKYLKSAKLTKLELTSSDPTNYPVSSFDTLKIFMDTSGTSRVLVATYVGALDSTILSYADILPNVKNSSNLVVLAFQAKKAPTVATKFTANLTLTFTADPLP